MKPCAIYTLLSILLATAPSRGEEGPWRIDLRLDLPLTLGLGAYSLVSEIVASHLDGPACGPLCDPGGVNALDRGVIGNRSALAADLSDAGFASVIALPYVLGGLDRLVSGGGGDLRGWAEDSLLLLQALSANFLVANLVKLSVRRPRPYAYDPAVPEETRRGAEASLSFYSGHSSTAFAMATAYALIYQARHPESPSRFAFFVGGYLLASGVALCRVAAGKHFWTDVLAGAAAGSLVGWLVVELHRRPDVTDQDTAGGSVSFLAGPGGVSLRAIW
ncbi:MAG: phosphatase PAP2 family protein [Myxococcales bacterium]|nr:phosphatase PAP2 family protein [Myxococcales bacterium]